MSTSYFENIRQNSIQQSLLAAAEVRRVLAEQCARAANRTTEALLSSQKAEGYWCADLLADTTLESDYILLQLWLHPPVAGLWSPPTFDRIRKAARSILGRQLPDGGYNVYPGGPADASALVKAYTALKLAGIDPESEQMIRLRQSIRDNGGIQSANSYVKINLSLFGLYPRDCVPTVPPELVLVPGGICMKCLPGHGPLSFRFPSSKPAAESARFRRVFISTSSPTRAPVSAFRAATKPPSSFSKSIALSSCGSAAVPETCATPLFARRKNGCSIIPATAKDSAPFIRR